MLLSDLNFINSDFDFDSYVDHATPNVCGQNFSEVFRI